MVRRLRGAVETRVIRGVNGGLTGEEALELDTDSEPRPLITKVSRAAEGLSGRIYSMVR